MSAHGTLGWLKTHGEAIRDEFGANCRVLTFAEYLALVEEAPSRHLRGAAQYLRDVFEHYGQEEVRHPTGNIRRFKLFDVPWEHGRGRLVGQEEAQNRIYRVLSNFARQGRVDRFILLHGPNGSSKSTITDVMARAMEDYSSLDEGALYRFNWMFPSQSVERSGIGFGGASGKRIGPADSYAHLDDTAIDARIACELRDHPLLVIPKRQRKQLVESLRESSAKDELPEYILEGNLCHKCKQIYEALLSAYEGDYLRVLRHVQVERFYLSQRYSVGLSRVEPQMAVDARVRQLTADRSLSALPSALQSVALLEVDGELARANRGMIDFADLFKRPLEAFKYLLTTVESGQVSMTHANLFLDQVFIGSANETHLNAFMESSEWMSFKARMELVRVPYLLDFRLEQQIYDTQVRDGPIGRAVAPHTAEAAAIWAVLTRMKRPKASACGEELAEIVGNMTPMEKARLYADHKVADGLPGDTAKKLRAGIEALYRETGTSVSYEGRTGASPREVKTAIMNAGQSPKHQCLTPDAVLAEIEALVQETSVYEFLRQDVAGPGYYDHKGFVDVARQWCLDRAADELRGAMGLVEESSYGDLFSRYVAHVTHFVRKEKIRNPVTGDFEDPDARLMNEVERTIDVKGDAAEFRHEMMSRIGAWSVDHPDQRPDYESIFSEYFTRLREQYFGKEHKRVQKLVRQALQVLSGEMSSLSDEEIRRVHDMLKRLDEEYGYCQACARETLVMLARHRYAA